MWDLKATDIQALHLALIALIGGAYRTAWYLNMLVRQKLLRLDWFRLSTEVLTGMLICLASFVLLLSYAPYTKPIAAAAMSWVCSWLGTKVMEGIWRTWVKRAMDDDLITQSKGEQ